MTDQQQQLTDEGHSGKYFHFMLNMADDDLDLYEYRLLGHYRRVCGAYNQPCTESTAETARKINGMSQGKVSETRRALCAKGWISLVEAPNNALHVTLVDRMAENIQRYCKPSPHEGLPDQPSGREGLTPKPSPHESSLQDVKAKPSPGEGKNQHIKNQHQNQPSDHESTPTDGGDGEIWNLIEPELDKLHLSPSARARLRGMEPAIALAITWAALKGHTPGGLAVTLMDTGPPEDLVQRAHTAVSLKTLNPRAIDLAINHGDLQQLSETVNELAQREQARDPKEPSSDQPNPPALPGAIPPGVLTQFNTLLRGMLAHPPGEWVYDVQARQFADGVLHISTSSSPDDVAAAFAGAGIAVEVVRA